MIGLEFMLKHHWQKLLPPPMGPEERGWYKGTEADRAWLKGLGDRLQKAANAADRLGEVVKTIDEACKRNGGLPF